MKAAVEKELPVVDPPKVVLIRFLLDIFFVIYFAFAAGVVALMVKVSDNWWDPWPGVLVIVPICIATFYLMPMMKDMFIQVYVNKQMYRAW